MLKIDPEVAERLIAAKRQPRPAAVTGAVVSAAQGRVRQGFSLGVFALEEKLADAGKGPRSCGIVRVLRRTGPERTFIQLEALGEYPAKDHCAEAPVADGQGFVPGFCGLAIPQHRIRRRCLGAGDLWRQPAQTERGRSPERGGIGVEPEGRSEFREWAGHAGIDPGENWRPTTCLA